MLSLNSLPDIRQGYWAARPDSFAHVMSAGVWKPARHLQWICSRIQPRLVQGNYYCIVNMPPGHGKSDLLSKWIPSWFLSWDLSRKVILTSYDSGLSYDFSRDVRDIVGERNVRRDSYAVARWRTHQGGGLAAAGVRGPITGRHGHLLSCDDPHKNWQDAVSEKSNETLHSWWKSTFMTRRMENSSVLLVGTRWADCDLTGWLLRESRLPWDHIVLRAIAEEDDPIGRKPGEPLWSSRYPLEGETGLNAIKEELGTRLFESMYQQRPVEGSGNIWSEDWFRFWTRPVLDGDLWEKELLPDRDDPEAEWIQSWDMNFKESGSSYVVGQVWCRKKAFCYLADQVRGKWSFVETLNQIRSLSKQYPQASLKLVEDKANGPAIISQLQSEMGGLVPVEPYGSKTARALAVSPQIESHNVYLPRPNAFPWVHGFLDECRKFPNSVNDDQVDATSQALSRFQLRGGGLLAGSL